MSRYGSVAHRFALDGDVRRCSRCGCTSTMPLATRGCPMPANLVREETRERMQAPTRAARKGDIYGREAWSVGERKGIKSALRLEVEAAGVAWEPYRDRRRRGATHEQALAGVDRRKVRG